MLTLQQALAAAVGFERGVVALRLVLELNFVRSLLH